MSTIRRIPLAQIDASGRLRKVNQAKVQVIADSILAHRAQDPSHSGLDQPVTVRPLGGDRFKLVLGGHRLDAVRLVGDAEIDAIVRELDEKQARIIEIDENLAREELTKLDRAAFLAERDRLWKELHPDAGKGKAGAKARWHHATENFSFASDPEIKAKVNLSDRQIRADVAMFSALERSGAVDRIRGTWLEDHQAQLKALAKCGPELQAKVLDAMLRAEKPAASVAEAVAEVEGRRKVEPAPDEAMYQKLISTWNRASAKARERFLSQLYEDGALAAFIDGEEAA